MSRVCLAMGSCFSSGSDDGKFKNELLLAHNAYRTKHHAPGLQVSSKAASQAQKWANHLARTGKLEHGGHDGMGQNLAYKSGAEFTAQEVADIWYNEVQSYNFSSPGFASNTGHFTQLVWKGTTHVGFGKAVRGSTTFVVANYVPPGNVAGQYEQNVLPA